MKYFYCVVLTESRISDVSVLLSFQRISTRILLPPWNGHVISWRTKMEDKDQSFLMGNSRCCRSRCCHETQLVPNRRAPEKCFLFCGRPSISSTWSTFPLRLHFKCLGLRSLLALETGRNITVVCNILTSREMIMDFLWAAALRTEQLSRNTQTGLWLMWL